MKTSSKMPRANALLKGLSWKLAPLLVAACAAGDAVFSAPSQNKWDDLNAEQRTAALFEAYADEPAFLRVLLRDMPKGGDLHTHLSGTPYAEEFLDWAATRDFCVDLDALAIVPPPCSTAEKEAARDLMRRNPMLYNKLVDAMSVRALLSGTPSEQNGHGQFFGSFERFLSIAALEPGKAIASTLRASAQDRVLYQEIMYNPASINIGAANVSSAGWSGDFESALAELEPKLPALVAQARSDADQAERGAQAALGCDANELNPGCDIEVRYNCYGLRLFPEAALFHQLATCFALTEADPRFVGVSLVQPEDDPIAVTQYDRHMEMVALFGARFPSAKISLHAGELTLGIVPGYALRDHISKAIHIAGSDRIGHGVDIAFEHDSRATLAHMADQGIAVEVNLSSNAVILGVEGKDHPLNLYRASGVPIVLSTDDLGVLRSDMTEQYVQAALDHGLTYEDLKTASRNSVHYAFIPGESLWSDKAVGTPIALCESFEAPQCLRFTANHPKAALGLRLEQAFIDFEAEVSTWTPDF